jgi:hypothetical protein
LPQRYSCLTLHLLYAIAYCILIPINAKLLITFCFVQINNLPPEIVSYFTDPNATGPPPDMQLLVPFVESALPVAYGVLAIQVFHVIDALSVEKLFINFFMQPLLLVLVLNLPHMIPLFMQEVGHFLAAFPKNVKLDIPFFIPNFTLGTFGAITQVSIP